MENEHCYSYVNADIDNYYMQKYKFYGIGESASKSKFCGNINTTGGNVYGIGSTVSYCENKGNIFNSKGATVCGLGSNVNYSVFSGGMSGINLAGVADNTANHVVNKGRMNCNAYAWGYSVIRNILRIQNICFSREK